MIRCLTETCRKYSQEPCVPKFGQALGEERDELLRSVDLMLVIVKLGVAGKEQTQPSRPEEFERLRSVPMYS